MDQSLETSETVGACESDGKQTQCCGESEDRKTEELMTEVVSQHQSNEQISQIEDDAYKASGASVSEVDHLLLRQNDLTEVGSDGHEKKLNINSDQSDSENADNDDNAVRKENTEVVDLVSPYKNESEKSDQYSDQFENQLEQLENNFVELENEVQSTPAVHTEDKNRKQSSCAEEASGHKLETESPNAVADLKDTG